MPLLIATMPCLFRRRWQRDIDLFEHDISFLCRLGISFEIALLIAIGLGADLGFL